MSFDFVGNEGDCWVSTATPITAGPDGMELSRIRTGINIANSSSNCESKVLTARTAGQITFRHFNNGNWASGVTHFAWRNSSGVEVLRIRNTAGSTQQLQYWNGSAFVGVGAAQVTANSINWRARLTYSGLGTSSGSLTLHYINTTSGTVVHTWTASGLDLTACTNIAQAVITKQTSGILTVGEFVMSQNDLTSVVCHAGVGTATGTDNTGATGTFAAIDDGATSGQNSGDDADFVALNGAGDRYSMTMPARNFAGKAVKSICINYRAKRGATGASSIRPYLKIGGTRFYAATQALTTAFVSSYQAFFDVNPATMSAWVAAAAEDAALEFGFEAAA